MKLLPIAVVGMALLIAAALVWGNPSFAETTDDGDFHCLHWMTWCASGS